MSEKQNKEKVAENNTKEKNKENKSILSLQLKYIAMSLVAVVICSYLFWNMGKVYILNNPNKPTIEMENCSLPLEMQYVSKIESGIYISSGYYGICFLDIDINEIAKRATVCISYYPDNLDIYGLPFYERYNCHITDKGDLVESESIAFAIAFDSDDHSAKFKIIDEKAFGIKDTLSIKRDLVSTPFSCIWLEEDPDNI